MPAVSVITPAWNAAAHIGETIASVRAQTFADWEWLIVDDGSTDDTVALIEQAAAVDPRIRLLRQEHGGPSGARNLAMAAASGRFFAFLDSDDVWYPAFLQAQLTRPGAPSMTRARASTSPTETTAPWPALRSTWG